MQDIKSQIFLDKYYEKKKKETREILIYLGTHNGFFIVYIFFKFK